MGGGVGRWRGRGKQRRGKGAGGAVAGVAARGGGEVGGTGGRYASREGGGEGGLSSKGEPDGVNSPWGFFFLAPSDLPEVVSVQVREGEGK